MAEERKLREQDQNLYGPEVARILAQGQPTGSQLYCIRLKRWDCPSCDREGILAVARHCPTCPQGKTLKEESELEAESKDREEREEYTPTDAYFYTKTDFASLKELFGKGSVAGGDQACTTCGVINGIGLTNCADCGALLPGISLTPVYHRNDSTLNRQSHSEKRREKREREHSSPQEGESPLPEPQSKLGAVLAWTRERINYFLLGLAAVVLGLVLYWLFWPIDVKAQVVSFSWSRVQEIEKFKPVRHTCTECSVPSGARDVSEREVQVGTRQVYAGEESTTCARTVPGRGGDIPCGTVDNRDGSVETVYCAPPPETVYEPCTKPKYEEEPVMGTEYSYTVDEWVWERSVTASGKDQKPYDPSYSLGYKERLGSRSENYWARFEAVDGSSYCSYYDSSHDLWDWQNMRIGEERTITINRACMVLGVR